MRRIRVGIIGTGFIARGLAELLLHHEHFTVDAVLTRRRLPLAVRPFDSLPMTHSPAKMLGLDVVVEATGDPIHATPIVAEILMAGIPVVTMDSELQITAGSWLATLGRFMEADGDQPGCLARLAAEVRGMGFRIAALGNVKGYLNQNPDMAVMQRYATQTGVSIEQITSFTDGTKIQVEQVLVANGLSAQLLQRGLLGPKVDSVHHLRDGAMALTQKALDSGSVVADYVLCPGSRGEVFVTATHDRNQLEFLRYYKMGDGPAYYFCKPYHLCHLEVPRSLAEAVASSAPACFNNGTSPRYSVGCVAKVKIPAGTKIVRGMGGPLLRGEALEIRSYPAHLPIGLAFDLTTTADIEPGELVLMSSVDIPRSDALSAWEYTLKNQIC